jgi:hypothetical protein
MHYLHQVRLIPHHLVDVFVGAGNLVQYTAVLAAFDADSLLFEVTTIEATLGLRSAHAPVRAVRAGT